MGAVVVWACEYFAIDRSPITSTEPNTKRRRGKEIL